MAGYDSNNILSISLKVVRCRYACRATESRMLVLKVPKSIPRPDPRHIYCIELINSTLLTLRASCFRMDLLCQVLQHFASRMGAEIR
jgi:hypothetical protein